MYDPEYPLSNLDTLFKLKKYVVEHKNGLLTINHLQRKCKITIIFMPKYLVISQKSSTFAADFALNASER
jgi:hypothetical protein